MEAKWTTLVAVAVVGAGFVMPSTQSQDAVDAYRRPKYIWYGAAIEALGDIDGDGAGDFAVGAPFAREHYERGERRGIVRIHSGADGAILRETYGRKYFGWRLDRAGDLDEDGLDDLAAEDDGGVVVLSSGTGEVILRVDAVQAGGDFPAARSVRLSAAGHDLDGDGIGDLLLGAEFDPPDEPTGTTGGVLVASGADGRIVRCIASPQLDPDGTVVGDLDGDGQDDLLLWSPLRPKRDNRYVTLRPSEVRIRAVSLCREPRLWEVALPLKFRLPAVVATTLDDVNGDQVQDVAVGVVTKLDGSPREDDPTHKEPRPPGSVWILSGATGGILHEITVRDQLGRFGYALDLTSDLDGDGVNELLVADYEHLYRGVSDPGGVHVASCVTGTILRTIPAPPPVRIRPWEHFAVTVAAIGDVDDDGVHDVAVGAMTDTPGGLYPGAVHVFSGRSGSRLYSLP